MVYIKCFSLPGMKLSKHLLLPCKVVGLLYSTVLTIDAASCEAVAAAAAVDNSMIERLTLQLLLGLTSLYLSVLWWCQ
jgi:hypothetical protein